MTVVLDAAMGTELTRRGSELRAPRWSAAALRDAPDRVRAIHRDHVLAGAQVVSTNTFSVLPGPDAADDIAIAVGLARDAIAQAGTELGDTRRVRIAGSVGALAHRHAHPGGRADAYRELATALHDAGCEIIIVETLIDVDDAAVAVESIGKADLPCPLWLSVACGHGARPLGSGALDELPSDGVDAVIVACTEADALGPAVATLATGRAWRGVAPNAGATTRDGFDPDGASAGEPLRSTLTAWRTHALELVGGCCGTTPSFVAALAAVVHPTPTDRTAAFDRLEQHLGSRA